MTALLLDRAISAVTCAVSAGLGVETTRVAAETSLFSLPGFDSLFIARLLEQLEADLGLECDPDLILPDTFATPRALAAAFVQSAEARGAE